MNTISVITICFNNLNELIETCRSVDEQTALPYEHLIIDGSSNSEIKNYLEQNAQPPYRRWICERDNGIADAFNKGILHVKGDIIHLLNSGDSYYDKEAIQIVTDYFKADNSLMWSHAQYVQHRGDIDIISGLPFDKNQLWKGMRQVAHPTMFIKKGVYDRHGLYNTDLKVAMDYDLLVRIRNEKFFFIPKPLSCFAAGGASSTQFTKGLEEVKKSYRQYIGYSFKQTLWQLRQKVLHYFMQTTSGKRWFQWKNRGREAVI
jgi:glycosyltransferase involved in cell wall biosynthesis